MNLYRILVYMPRTVGHHWRLFRWQNVPVHAKCPVVSDSETLWTVGHQALLLMEFSRQENWSVLPCPPPRDLPNLGIQARSSMSPAFAGGFFATSTTWKALSSRVALPYSPTQYRRPQSFQHFSDSPFTDHWSALA